MSLFEGRGNNMTSQKESQFTVRLDDETYSWFLRKAGKLDTSRSSIVRAAIIGFMPLLETFPDLLNIQLKDIKDAEE